MSARERRDRPLRVVMPIVVLALGIAAWQAVVQYKNIPPYVLPAPDLIAQTFATDWELLLRSLLVTVITTVEGFLLAAFGGVFLAILFNQSRFLEYSLYPYAVVLQVTPIVAVAPLLLIYLPQHAAVLVCAWIVAFFPVLANTTLGLRSVDRNLADLFALYGASRWQILRRLKLPSALPYILGGLRIAGGLSLIGAVVAEIAAGSAGAGLGPRSTRLRTPPSSAIARSAMSCGNGLPCQPFLFSTSEKPRPLIVLARITVGWLLAGSVATVIALSTAARSCPSTLSTRAPNASIRRA